MNESFEGAAEAGIELDPDDPWETWNAMRRESRRLHTLARVLRTQPEELPARVEVLLERINKAEALRDQVSQLEPIPTITAGWIEGYTPATTSSPTTVF